jgi:hypothetical protein
MGVIAWGVIGILMAINIGLFWYFYTRIQTVQKSISQTVESLQKKFSDMGLTDDGFKVLFDDYKRLLAQESKRISEIDQRVKLTGEQKK